MSIFMLVCLLGLTFLGASRSKNEAGQSSELPFLTLHKAESGYFLQVEVDGSWLEIPAQISGNFTWLKVDECRVCKDEKDKCDEGCFTTKKKSSIKCADCTGTAQRREQLRMNITKAIRGQAVWKVKGQDKSKFSLLFVEQMSAPSEVVGSFTLLGQDTVFQKALILKQQETLQVYNQGIPQQTRAQFDTSTQVTLLNSSEPYDGLWGLKLSLLRLYNPNKEKAEVFVENIAAVIISLATDALILPAAMFRKFQRGLAETFFEGNGCKLVSGAIECDKVIDLDYLNNAKIELKINEVSFEFPFKILLTSCEKQSCKIRLLKAADSDKKVTIGNFLFEAYALSYNLQNKNKVITLHRFTALPGMEIDKKQSGFIMTTLYLIYRSFAFIFKSIFYLALMALAVNAIVFRSKIREWCGLLFYKLFSRGKGEYIVDDEGSIFSHHNQLRSFDQNS